MHPQTIDGRFQSEACVSNMLVIITAELPPDFYFENS